MIDIELLLTEKGVKPTANRILIYRCLESATRPLCLSDFEELTDYSVDKASIFRTLELFEEKDVVHAIEDGSRALKYELCHGSGHIHILHQHPHFYCEECHTTYCLDNLQIPLINLPVDFSARSINYLIKGVCPKCKNRL